MASNGAMSGNSDYAYLPLGWTCQVLLNTSTQNLGYDVAYPGAVHPPLKPVPTEEPKDAEKPEFAAAHKVPVGGVFPTGVVGVTVPEAKEEKPEEEPEAKTDNDEGAN